MGIFSKKEKEERQAQKPFRILAYSGGNLYRADHAMKLSAVYRSVNLISDQVAQLPVYCYKSDDNGYLQRDVNNDIEILINRHPNARQTRYQYMKLMICSMLLSGNGYSYIERDESGKPIAIHYLPSEFVTVNEPIFLQQAATYTVTGFPNEVAARDMIHLMMYTSDGLNGESVISHADKVLKLAWASEDFAETFFNSGCNAFGVLKVDAPMQKSQKKEAKQEFIKSRQDIDTQGIMVLDQGMSYEPITVSPKDSMLLESRQYSISEIARMFNVPPSRLYVSSSVSYSSLEMDSLLFLQDCIGPLCEKIAQEIQRKLFADDDDVIVKFDTDQMIQMDNKSKAEYYTKLVGSGLISINEGRQALGLPKIENGDFNFVPVNQMTVDNAVNNKPTDDKVVNETIDVNEEK